ncbi:MAG: exodeoxyribonuclease VII small subunit [Ignavibacteria bacterium CG2_30_36_16]|nr:MAG: exodeoxyribonuclease VII small subunit [Ignavibacteria bacterium CG2_30_36_16]PJB01262.1 MAG: exodeoxyribonuclease VII small subunit [Ignavibacteria bacterium CG_4_9_14_3_um_filter_36_18]
MSKKKEKNTFEENLQRLEEIAALLEGEEVSLEDSINLFEEGINLSKGCIDELKNAELKITELKKKLNEMPSQEDDIFEE